MQTTIQMPVAENLFQGKGASARLIGTRCMSCGTHYFPKSLSCRNPQCRDKKVEDALFGRYGTLYSFTLQKYRPPALFRMDDWAPYTIGLVELPEGIRVMGMLTGCRNDEVHIGMQLELTVETLYRDEEGREVLTYKYMPSAAAGVTP